MSDAYPAPRGPCRPRLCSRGSSRSSTRSSRCRSPTSARCSPSTASRPAHDLLWITVAMVGARSLAMALNRLIDVGIDAANPRTAGPRAAVGAADGRRRARVLRRLARRLPDRRLAARPDRPLALADPGGGVRRSTRTSSASRGSATSGSARSTRSRRSAAGSRSRGSCRGRRGRSAARSATWVAGFDLFYSLFDLEIDRAQGLHSWATRFGERGVFVGARVLHALTVVLLAAVGLGLDGRRLVLARRAGGGAAARLRALARAPGRPAPARRRVLHHERRDQRRVLRLRARGRPVSVIARATARRHLNR